MARVLLSGRLGDPLMGALSALGVDVSPLSDAVPGVLLVVSRTAAEAVETLAKSRPLVHPACTNAWIACAPEPKLSVAFSGGFDDVVSPADSTLSTANRLKNLANLAEKRSLYTAQVETLKAESSQLGEQTQALEAFIFAVAHDIKGPLISIARFSQIAQEDLAQDHIQDVATTLERIDKNARRARRLIGDTITFTQLGRANLATGMCPIEHLCSDAKVELRDVLADTDFNASPTPLVVLGDYERLLEALKQLILNAVKYAGGHRPVIELKASASDGWCTLALTDNGIGIPPNQQARIFEPFVRLHRKDEIEGSGLGLNIATRTVARHGGRLWLESVVGVGTTVFMQLPIGPASGG